MTESRDVVVGVFRDRARAQDAIAALRQAGFRKSGGAGGPPAMAREQTPAAAGPGAAASGAQDRVTPLAAAFDRGMPSDGPDRPATEMQETPPGRPGRGAQSGGAAPRRASPRAGAAPPRGRGTRARLPGPGIRRPPIRRHFGREQ